MWWLEAASTPPHTPGNTWGVPTAGLGPLIFTARRDLWPRSGEGERAGGCWRHEGIRGRPRGRAGETQRHRAREKQGWVPSAACRHPSKPGDRGGSEAPARCEDFAFGHRCEVGRTPVPGSAHGNRGDPEEGGGPRGLSWGVGAESPFRTADVGSKCTCGGCPWWSGG